MTTARSSVSRGFKLAICAALALAAVAPLAAHQPHDALVSLAMSPSFSSDQTMIAATDYLSVTIGVYIVLKSVDGGVTWAVMHDLPNSPVTAIRYSPAYAQDKTIFISTLAGLYKSTSKGRSWSPAGSFAAGVQDVAVSPNFASDNTVFAADIAGNLFRSTNGGSTWANLASPGAGVVEVGVSPNYATDKMLLAGTNNSGVYRSLDGGATWNPVTSGLTLSQVKAFGFSPSYNSDRTVFVATKGSGVFVSTNGGGAWSAANTGITDLNATSFAFSPAYAQDGTLWVTTAAAGVYKSANRGSSWLAPTSIPRHLSDQTQTHYRALGASDTGGATVVWLATFEGIWSSNDMGGTWLYGDILPTHLVRKMRTSPNYKADQTVFATSYGSGNLVSTNGGQSWTFQNTGMISPYPDAIGISPNYANDGVMFSGIVTGLQRSTNRGASWQMMNALGAPTFVRALDISPGFAQDNSVFPGTDNFGNPFPRLVQYQGSWVFNQGLFLSTDRGNNWMPTGLGGPRIHGIAVSPGYVSDRTIFAATDDAVMRSTDGAATWTSISLGNGDAILHVAVSPAYPSDRTVFAATNQSGIFKSIDGGATWTLLPGSNTLTALDIAISPNYIADQTLFISTLQEGLMKSVNGGATLAATSLIDNYVTAIAVSSNYAQDQTVFAAGYHGIYKTVDGGTTWTYTAEPARQEQDRDVSITYSGTWKNNPAPLASTSAQQTTSQPGAKVSLRFVGDGVQWIGQKGPALGNAIVQLDGVSVAGASQNAPQDQWQQPVWTKRGLTCAVHTLTIVAMPQTGLSSALDAFDVFRDSCPH